jgi:hypothetical protein
MTTTLQQLTASQANKEVAVNRNFETTSWSGVYGKKQSTSTGLTWGYYGGRWGGFSVADGTFTLTNTTDNYIVAKRSDGVTSASTATTNWNNTADYARVYKVTTAGSVVTATEDHRAGLYGVHGSSSSSSGVATDTIWDAAGDLVQGTGSNTAARLALGTAGQVLKVNAGATAVEWGASAGDVATDAIWDAAGDLAVGSGANTAAKLAIGTALQVLRVNAGATALEWAAAASGSGTKTYAVFTPMTSQPPASNYATLDTRNSIAVLDFDDTTEESVFWVGAMPEAASLGSGLIVNIFFMATSATSGDARFGAQFERMNTDEDSDSFDTATEATVTTSGTSGIVTKLAITCTTIDSIAAGEAYRLKIYRDTSGADTITGDVEVVAVELRSAA